MVINTSENAAAINCQTADYLGRFPQIISDGLPLSQSAVNEAKAHYIGCHRRLSWAYFSSAMAGLK